SFLTRLSSYCVDNNVNDVQGNNLLTLLRTHECFNHFPKDIRTLVHTPRNRVTTYVVAPGEYIHFSQEVEIVKYLNNCPYSSSIHEIQLDFHTDGYSLDRAGSIQLWPIQCMIRNLPHARPVIVGIYRGPQKPDSPCSFFSKFIRDVQDIISKGGIDFHGTKVPIKLRCFIADAPARAFILNHRSHISNRPCSKCKVSGVQSERRLAYIGVDHPLRTDVQYVQCLDEDHHKEGGSPLASLSFGMVSQVPFEYMHLVCLGVVKKLLSAWICGKYSRSSKLSSSQVSLMSARLESLRQYCPSNFARRPRSIQQFSNYKAVEFRQFLLYTGPVIASGILPDKLFNHFLLLHSAIRVLASQSPSPGYLNFAEIALQKFVLRSEQLYGPHFCSYNIHGLLHLTEDVRRLGSVDSFSAFPYESNMKVFKKYCRKAGQPLQQIVKRMAEIDSSRVYVNRDQVSSIQVSMPIGSGTESHLQYRKIQFNGMAFSVDVRDNCCILQNGTISIICSIVKQGDGVQLGVRSFLQVDDMYDIGAKSSALGLYKCRHLCREYFINVNDVFGKCFRMPLPGGEVEAEDNKEYAIAVLLNSQDM
ncbi:uncharacterized protein LOC113465227, partial [Ceratina calcarata]|uniref:Uncharacterized protein LOC113465227 n=1 Tax=Ceratina calcarata TaxID=156304 RepID=A0AAJ7SDS8_9HYME